MTTTKTTPGAITRVLKAAGFWKAGGGFDGFDTFAGNDGDVRLVVSHVDALRLDRYAEVLEAKGYAVDVLYRSDKIGRLNAVVTKKEA